MKEKVGSLPEPGDINPGDPGHIAVHDEMAQIVQEAADAAGIILDPPAPPPAVVGQYGHVDAHNRLLANLEQLAEAGVIGGGAPGAAVLTSATGSPKRYEYPEYGPDGETLWVAYEWTDTSVPHVLTSQEGGLAEVLLVGGGKAGNGSCNQDSSSASGHGGGVFAGKAFLEVHNELTVGKGGETGGKGYNTPGRLGGESLVGVYKSGTVSPSETGVTSTITGTAITKAKKGPAAPMGWANGASGAANSGDGGQGAGRGTPNELEAGKGGTGIIVVRVPKENDKIPNSQWITRTDYYAEVTDGIVTDLYQEKVYGDDTVRTENGKYASPEQPEDLIPCDPIVTEGWSYDGTDFAPPLPPPPPTREELVAELQARSDELTKDKK